MDVKSSKEYLFQNGNPVYLIFDGAAVDDPLRIFDDFSQPHLSLYRGNLDEQIKEVSPYLTILTAQSNFTNWVLQNFGKNHGIFIRSNLPFVEMRRHFRSFLQVYDENHKPMLFRYYDPRVLRTFLPTCNSHELREFFGSVTEFLCEAKEKKELVSFTLENGALVTRHFELSDSDVRSQ